MDQEKIGNFIAEKRKAKKLTQVELAEKLGVTDRAISNWENGKNMPDLSLFKPLCDILEITINELISGENLNNKEYNEKLEENIINTIDYIDKKNIKSDDRKSILLLVIAIIAISLSNFIFNTYEGYEYLVVVGMILAIYSIKRFFMKYLWVRKVIGLVLFILCILSLFLIH